MLDKFMLLLLGQEELRMRRLLGALAGCSICESALQEPHQPLGQTSFAFINSFL